MVKLLRSTVRQGVGKLRRFALHNLKKKYITKQLDLRQGECSRCGLCCKLLFHCPFLERQPNGETTCRIYDRRPTNCRIFPINNKDILDINGMDPEIECSYSFLDSNQLVTPTSDTNQKKTA